MRFQLLRYVPDAVKDEFLNIGVVMLDDRGRSVATRMASDEDLRRVRCLHPGADLELLRSCQAAVETEAQRDPEAAGAWLASLLEVASHSLRWTDPRGYDGADAEAGAQQLYESFVASRPRPAGGARTGTGLWVKREADSVFRAEHLLERFESGVWAQQFTYPGDPFRIHYAYRNGAARYIHMLSLQHSVQQAKVLAFTFERMRGNGAQMTAVVEPDPPRLPTVEFTRELLQQGEIEVLPLDRIQGFVRRVKQELRIQ